MGMVEAIQKAGVVGAGGAGFPTHVKLNAKAEYLIINAAECEPLIETDKYLCRTFPERIVSTVLKMKEHLGAAHAVIALKGKYIKEIEALEQAITAAGADVEIFKAGAGAPGDRKSRAGAGTAAECGLRGRERGNGAFHRRRSGG